MRSDPICRGGVLVSALIAVADLGGQEPGSAAVPAFVETTTERTAYFVGQTMRVRIRFGIERRFLATNVIQLFRQPLGIPVQVQADWWSGLPGADALPEASAGPDQRTTFALDNRIRTAPRATVRRPDGHEYTVLEVTRDYRLQNPGQLTIPPARLRLAYGTEFRDDLVAGRVAADRRMVVIASTPRQVQVQVLPAAGRPTDFGGAIGDYAITARADPTRLAVGEALILEVRITGSPDTSTFAAPGLGVLAGFHLRGQIDDKGRRVRTIRYDLTPVRAGVQVLPPVALSFFDPAGAGAYRTVRSTPLPIAVAPGAPPAVSGRLAAPVERLVPGENDIFDLKPRPAGRPPMRSEPHSAAVLLAWLLVPWGLAFATRSWWRSRRVHRHPERRRAQQALVAFRARLAAPDADLADALTDYLAARLGVSPAAVISHHLPGHLQRAGLDVGLAAQAADTLESLAAVRYGGAAAASGVERVRGLVEAMETAFRQSD